MASRPSMLLHVCCAPCSTHVIEKLRRDYDLGCFFYNPNIYPQEEYEKRLEEMERYATKKGVNFIPGDYDYERWLSLTQPLKGEKEGGKRCELCFEIRLEETASFASEHDFQYFATTLSISTHKRVAVINSVGLALAKKCGLKFLEEDFKKKDGFKHSVEISKAECLYRQDYCGCIYSKLERNKGKTE